MTPLTVDIWLWHLAPPGGPDGAMLDCLSADERARAQAFHFDTDRNAFVIARAGLRSILSGYLGNSPAGISFAYGAAGKPSVSGGPHFNLSHAHGRAALAVSPDVSIGIDIEAQRPIETGVASLALSPAEAAEMTSLSEAEWLVRFFRAWTSKEAYVKASGEGLSHDLTSFDVCYDARGLGRIHRHTGDGAHDGAWTFNLFAPFPDYAGAVAACTGGRPLALTFHHWTP